MIHLIVGNTGAGKTTYATKLKENSPSVVFSIDVWNKILFLPDKKETDGLHWFLERIDRSEAMIQQLVLQLEGAGTDTILDLGLSKFEHREKFRQFAVRNGLETKLHFLDVPAEERKRRVLQRNKEQGDTFAFEVSEEDFLFMETYFERPTEEELIDGVVVSE